MADLLYLYPNSDVVNGLRGTFADIDDPAATPDDDTTYVEQLSCPNFTAAALYGLPNSVDLGPIDKITVYYRWRSTGTNTAGCWCQIKTHGANYYVEESVTLSLTYHVLSKQWTTNPFTGAAWTWAEINDLQLYIISAGNQSDPHSDETQSRGRCTQTYVVAEGTWYVVPTDHTDAATSIDHVSGILNGNLTATGGMNCTVRGFEWKKGVAGDVTTVPETGDFGTGVFHYDLIGLENYTEYYFRAYATNSIGTTYGEWLTFTTLRTYPTVTIQAATDLATTTITTNGNITALGGENATIEGFDYGLTKIATWNQHSHGSFTIGAFHEHLTGLSANTEYWIRAYATNSIGTRYTDYIQFQTAAVGVIPTGTKLDICGDYSGYTFQLNASLNDDGIAYEGYFVINSDLSDNQGLSYYKRLLDIHLYFNKETSGSASVSVKRDNETTWLLLGSVVLTGDEDILVKHLAVDVRAKTFLFKISATNQFEFLGMILEFIVSGDR